MATGRNCQGRNAAGEPCRHPVVNDDGWCPAHGPGGAERMVELGRKGRRLQIEQARRPGFADRVEDIPKLMSVADAKARLDLIGRAVLAGTLEQRDASAATRAVEAWLRAESDRLALAVDTLEETLHEKERELDELRRELSRRDSLKVS